MAIETVSGSLRAAFEIEIDYVDKDKAPRNKPGIWPRIIAEAKECALRIRVRAINKSDVGAIICRAPFAREGIAEITACIIKIPVICESVAGTIDVLVEVSLVEMMPRRRAEHLKSEYRFRVNFESPVNARQLIVLLDKVIARHDHAERRLSAHIALIAQHANVGVLVQKFGDVNQRAGVIAFFFGVIARRVVRSQ